MKKTCAGCKALYYEQGYGYYCYLGYKLDVDKAVPAENCPKPKTNKMLIRICREQMQYKKEQNK